MRMCVLLERSNSFSFLKLLRASWRALSTSPLPWLPASLFLSSWSSGLLKVFTWSLSSPWVSWSFLLWSFMSPDTDHFACLSRYLKGMKDIRSWLLIITFLLVSINNQQSGMRASFWASHSYEIKTITYSTERHLVSGTLKIFKPEFFFEIFMLSVLLV